MCRTASLLLLQRLKGSMSGDARDFNNIEKRSLKISLFRLENIGTEFLTCAVYIVQGKLALQWMDLVTNICYQVSLRVYNKMKVFLI